MVDENRKVVIARHIGPGHEALAEVIGADTLESEYCLPGKTFIIDPSKIQLGPMHFEYAEFENEDPNELTYTLKWVGDLILEGDD